MTTNCRACCQTCPLKWPEGIVYTTEPTIIPEAERVCRKCCAACPLYRAHQHSSNNTGCDECPLADVKELSKGKCCAGCKWHQKGND